MTDSGKGHCMATGSDKGYSMTFIIFTCDSCTCIGSQINHTNTK
jgi:hypothetical protein